MIDIPTIVDWLHQHPQWVVSGIALVAFVESLAIAGIIVPGIAILFAIAVVAGGADIALSQALLAGIVGAVCGDTLSFYLGYHYQDRLRAVWPFSRYPDALASGETFFKKHGGKSVVLGRFIGPLRPVLPVIAGMFGMKPVRFISINLVSALAWSPVYILPGYFVGAAVNITPPEHWLSLLGSLSIALLLTSLAFGYASRRLQHGESWYELLHRQGLLGRHTNYDKPLASLVLLSVSASLFVLWSIATSMQAVPEWDQLWLEFALSIEFKALHTFFVATTLLGDESFLTFSFVLCTIALLCTRQWRPAIAIAASGLATSAITHALKEWFYLPRPDVLAHAIDSMAYPSGHTSGAVVLFGMVATLCAERVAPIHRWKIYLSIIMPALLIGFSRIALAAHWFSDVVGGFLLGLVICSVARLAYGTMTRSMPKNLPALETNQRFLLMMALVIWFIGALTYLTINLDSGFTRYAQLN